MSTNDTPFTILTVFLDSGSVIRLKVTTWTLKKSHHSNELTELSWTMADGSTMPYLRLSSVLAVVEEAS